MEKKFLNLGKSLSKNEQKKVNGGIGYNCDLWSAFHYGSCMQSVNNHEHCSGSAALFADRCKNEVN